MQRTPIHTHSIYIFIKKGIKDRTGTQENKSQLSFFILFNYNNILTTHTYIFQLPCDLGYSPAIPFADCLIFFIFGELR